MTESVAALQAALSSLQANRALTEQFVRDVKAGIDPSDPAYAETMESYQTARELYDRYLDGIEDGEKASHSRSLRHVTPVDVQNAAADFLADADNGLEAGNQHAENSVPAGPSWYLPILGKHSKKLPKKGEGADH